jgi:hypothetical protein
MKLNLQSIVAIGCLASPLASLAQSPTTFSDDQWISLGGSPGVHDWGFGPGSGLPRDAFGLFPGVSVNASVVDGLGSLYIGGFFKTAGGVKAANIAKWDGTNWSGVGSGFNGNVFALAVSGNDLYAAGQFTTAGGVAANGIAKWNGSNWNALGAGMNSNVFALAMSGSDLYAGGDFTTAGGVAANRIAKWNGSSWSALGSGLEQTPGNLLVASVRALAVSGSDLYVGGAFTMAGGVPASKIAKWNGSSWSALGSGLEPAPGTEDITLVSALAVAEGELYAGGTFTIAKWNGSSWTALGFGPIGSVRTLALSGSDLHAGGVFTKAGGVPAHHIAKFNGSNWSALGSEVLNDVVSALAVSGRDLYLGGYFTNAGRVAANHIVKWDGNSWSALGSGMTGSVYALAVSESNVYAGGYFTTAGGVTASNIAKWNGTSWSALGSGMADPEGSYLVYALTVSGGDLYAGGQFQWGGGLPASNIAKWNGSLDSGNWINVTDSILDDGTNHLMTQPIGTSRFFRLVPH